MATARPTLAAEHREVTGKRVHRLRKDGRLPAVVYGHGEGSAPVSIDAHEFELLRKHTGPNALVDLSNRPGALADVAALLGENHININYAYVTSGAPGGRTTGVFKVADLNKALRVLKKPGDKHKEPTGRRAAGRR